MPLPAAYLVITLREIRDIARGSDVDHPCILATVGGRRRGRSRRIDADGTFDVTAEREPWTWSVAVEDAQSVPVEIAIIDDRPDEDPREIATISGAIPAPWRPGEVVIGDGPAAVFDVATTRAQQPTGDAFARRAPDESAPSAVLRTRRAAILQINEVQGLYKPGHVPDVLPAGRTQPRLAEYEPGYASHDDRGRIYVNRDLAGAWTKDTQLIELAVQTSLQGGLTLPSDAKIIWTWEDPDDPVNDDPGFHRQWGAYVDRDDYAAGVHRGACADDNRNAVRNDRSVGYADLYDKSGNPWEEVSGYTLSDAAERTCKTTIDAATMISRVRLHCPNVGGANLLVRAHLDPHPGAPVIPARTGTMTMWKRIDVDVARMDGALPVTPLLADIPRYYESSCVQLDFHPERTLPASDSPDFIKTADAQNLSDRAGAWVDRVFRRDPAGAAQDRRGWFFLGSAKRADSTSMITPGGSRTPPVFDSDASGSTYTAHEMTAADINSRARGQYGIGYVEVNRVLPNPDRIAGVEFRWRTSVNGRDEDVSIRFGTINRWATTTGSSTRIFYWGKDLTPGFTGHDSDGSISHAMSDALYFCAARTWSRVARNWQGTGYGVPPTARLLLHPSTALETAGISPPIENAANRYFAGRTIVFTHHPRYVRWNGTPPTASPSSDFEARVSSTIIHEFAHAFGMPHKCGYWDQQADRRDARGDYKAARACAMNYPDHWNFRINSTQEIEAITDRLKRGKSGPYLCGRHIAEIRRVHLEDNSGLNWT